MYMGLQTNRDNDTAQYLFIVQNLRPDYKH